MGAVDGIARSVRALVMPAAPDTNAASATSSRRASKSIVFRLESSATRLCSAPLQPAPSWLALSRSLPARLLILGRKSGGRSPLSRESSCCPM